MLNPYSNLLLTKDRKMVMTKRQPWLFPVDVNNAGLEELLWVPVVGPISARRSKTGYAEHSIDSVEQLKKMGVVTKRAGAFVWFRGASAHEKQWCFPRRLGNNDSEELPSMAGTPPSLYDEEA